MANNQHREVRENASVVLIGMKKAGKTTLGKIVASRMKFKFMDLDDAFVAEQNRSIADFIGRYGWEHFREAETSVLVKILDENPTNTIIATGGGIIELTVNHAYLKEWRELGGLVVHVDSDWNKMKKEFEGDLPNHIPHANDEPFDQVVKRRAPLYRQCSNYQFYRVGGKQDVGKVATDLERLIRFARGELGSPLPSKTQYRSFVVCIAVPDVSAIKNELPIIINGFHAVEVRIDHLRQPNKPPGFKFDQDSLQVYENYVARQLAIVRGQIGSTPIIYTIRTVSEGGAFPDDTPQANFESLYNLGIRLGCEFIDVQLSTRSIFAPLDKGQSKIIASYHQFNSPLAWGDATVSNILREGQEFGDIVKLVSQSVNDKHNRRLEDFLNENSTSEIPIIALELSISGQSSRLMNRYLTPATHASLPNSSAPGQLTLQQINQGLTLLGQIPPRKYYVFGHPVTQSKSPLLHNAVFKSLGLPHSMDLFDRTDVNEFLELLKTPDFHGSCVTMPYKEMMLPKMDVLSDAATIIGSINTVFRDDVTGLFHGDNTDWIGIYKNVKKSLDTLDTEGSASSTSNRTAGLVLGAGGTARAAIYALHKLDFQDIFVHNRTQEEVVALTLDFAKSGIKITGVENLFEFQKKNLEISVVIDTCPPVAKFCTEQFLSDIFALCHQRGVVVRLAYNREAIEDKVNSIVNVSGIEILIDQAIEQDVIWTGLRPSRRFIEDTLRANDVKW